MIGSGIAAEGDGDDARGVIERTPEEQAKDVSRRRWARAVARGLALGGLLALGGGLSGLMAGLVATPLAWVEVWGARRRRPIAAPLLAWVTALVWLCGAHLQGVYMTALRGRDGVGGAFEAVRLAALQLVTPVEPTDVVAGPLLVFGALVLSTPVAIELSWQHSLAPYVVTALVLLALGALSVLLMTVPLTWILVIIVMGLNTLADRAADRTMVGRVTEGSDV